MVKGLPLSARPQWEHAPYSGGDFNSASKDIEGGRLRVGGRRVILVHMGTNPIDIRGWKGRLTCEQRLFEIMAQVKRFYEAVRRYNATCFIIFSSVLPRPVDWIHSKVLCCKFTKSLRAFARKRNCGFLPSYTSFIVRDAGPLRGEPLPGLWAKRDGGLHLNLNGRAIMEGRLKDALHPNRLGQMAREVKFPHWK